MIIDLLITVVVPMLVMAMGKHFALFSWTSPPPTACCLLPRIHRCRPSVQHHRGLRLCASNLEYSSCLCARLCLASYHRCYLGLLWRRVLACFSAALTTHPKLSYPALIIRAFMKRRKQFKDLIVFDSNLTYNYYWRLIALASLDFCFTIPLAIRTITVGVLLHVDPWVSWADTHSRYSRVYQIPRIILDLHPALEYSFEITRWAAVLCAFVFFGFFGFVNEATRNYRLLASTIAKFFGFNIFPERVSTPGSPVIDHSLRFTLPVSITQQTMSRRDSDSFSEKLLTMANNFDLEVQPHSPIKSIDEVLPVPEPALDPALVRKPFVLDNSTPTCLGNALDRA